MRQMAAREADVAAYKVLQAKHKQMEADQEQEVEAPAEE